MMTCQQLHLDKAICYVRFAPGKVVHTVAINRETARGEMLLIDLDAQGQVVGIDLVAPALKPCQQHYPWPHEGKAEVLKATVEGDPIHDDPSQVD